MNRWRRALADVPGAREVESGRLYAAGQPEPRHWSALAAAGFVRVVDLRPASEAPERREADAARAAGLEYRNLPVAGEADLMRVTVDALDDALRDADGAVLVHCASGNRVGALLALHAAWCARASAAEALARGEAAGLAGLRDAVRARLAPANPLSA